MHSMCIIAHLPAHRQFRPLLFGLSIAFHQNKQEMWNKRLAVALGFYQSRSDSCIPEKAPLPTPEVLPGLLHLKPKGYSALPISFDLFTGELPPRGLTRTGRKQNKSIVLLLDPFFCLSTTHTCLWVVIAGSIVLSRSKLDACMLAARVN
jgi:hypothetical protein